MLKNRLGHLASLPGRQARENRLATVRTGMLLRLEINGRDDRGELWASSRTPPLLTDINADRVWLLRSEGRLLSVRVPLSRAGAAAL